MSSRAQIYTEGFAQGLPLEDRVTRLLALAKSLHGRRLLDIGCGDGALTLKLARQLGAAEISGIDISEGACVLARAQGIGAITLDIDGASLPFESASFDVVYAGEILEHLFDVDTFLDEVHRVLTPDGAAIIDTPNLACWYDRVSLLLGYQPLTTEATLRFGSAGKILGASLPGSGGHLRILTVRAFIQVMALHGFRIERLVGAAGALRTRLLPPLIQRPFEWLNRSISRISPALAPFMIALVRKRLEHHAQGN